MGTDSDEKLVEIGVVGRAHGIVGAVVVFLHNPDSSLLEKRKWVMLKDRSGTRKITISDCRKGPKNRVVVFEGISNRTDAEKLKGAELLVPRASLPRLDEEEFYIADLIGIEAWDGEKLLGVVTSSRPQADIEVITVTGESSFVEIPLVEDFVVSLDFESGRIHLTDTHLLPAVAVKKSPRKKHPR